MTFGQNALATIVAGLLLTLGASLAEAHGPRIGAVYTMTNDTAENSVLAYDRLPNGSLHYRDSYATGGNGSGDGLGSQGSVVLSRDGRWLLAVNAGSDDISVFAVHRHALVLKDTLSSGGARPISLAIHGDLVYVVNAGGQVGGADSISALTLSHSGHLSELMGSSAPLSGADVGPAQIIFAPSGDFVLVAEKGTKTISAFPIDDDGYAGVPVFNASEGETPFAVASGRDDQIFVSEVFGGDDDAGAVSSYALMGDGSLGTISASVPNTETAPCWLVVTRNGRRLFTTNTPDDSISEYLIAPGGQIALRDADGRTGEPGDGTRPLDMSLSRNGRHLYTLNIGAGTISTFRVGPHGSLHETSTVDGLPTGVVGLAAR